MTAPPPPKAIAPPQAEAMDAQGRTILRSIGTNQVNPYELVAMDEATRMQLRGQMAMQPKPIGNIAKAISSVMSEIGVVAKEGVNQFHRYKYATIGDVLHKLTPLLGKHGLMIVQNEVEHKFDQKHVAVTYEFSIAHASGEVWPEKPRKTGMSLAVDSKGNWDDKAFNKAATAARKYFLLELFQVPTGDMEDADSDATAPANTSPPPSQTRTSAPPPPPPPQSSNTPVETEPHRIVLGKGAGPAAWTEAFIKAVGTAETSDELQAWIETNSPIMANLASSNPDLYQRVQAATTSKHESFESVPEQDIDWRDFTKPLAANDFDAAINIITNRLANFTSQEDLEAWWNKDVAPTEEKWFPPDWILLIREFERNEVRIAAQEAK